VEVDIANQSVLVSDKQNNYSFILYQNIGSTFFRFVTNHGCDKQTDGQNYDPQDRASIDASRGKKNNIKYSKELPEKQMLAANANNYEN